MKNFIHKIQISILLLILIIGPQSWINADDIKDFEIEGMSVGDSLLDFFDKNLIENEIKDAAFYPNSKSFMILSLIPKNMKQYENLNFHIKKNDKKYLIYSVKGMINLETEECLKIKKDVDTEIQKIVPNSEMRNHTNYYNNNFGDSKAHISDYYIKDGVIRVFCTDWDKKFIEEKYNKNYSNTLSVNSTTDELRIWIQNEAYKK